MKTEATGDRIRIEVDLAVPRHGAWAFLAETHHIADWWGELIEAHAAGWSRHLARLVDHPAQRRPR